MSGDKNRKITVLSSLIHRYAGISGNFFLLAMERI